MKSRGEYATMGVSENQNSPIGGHIYRALNKLSLCVFFAMLICALPARGQTSASIKGIVTDALGARVADANVRVKNVETGATRIVTTTDDGRFLVLSLVIGNYEVKVSKQGFQDV
nr:carboxypeptidase-like regulatory domain-containing protein [Candidatus Acidoferrales bacterium]